MRFGIEQMQVGWLVQHARTLMPASGQVDVQALRAALPYVTVDVAEQVNHLADLGFALVELNPELSIFFPNCYNLAAVARLERLKEERHMSYTVHLPLWSLEPSTPVQAVRQGSVDTLVDAVLRLEPLEPEVYVLHATGALAAEFSRMKSLESMRSLVLQLFVAQAQHSIEELLKRTGLSPRRVAVETVEFPFDLTLDLAQTFDLSMCLDVGHVVAGYTTGVTLFEALDQMLPRLAEVHLHDAYRRELPGGIVQVADHMPLGAGEVPLGDFLGRLAASGFSGPVIFELTIEEALASLQMVEALRSGLVGR
jgi:sugar phosphate isomerase/epimerase